MNSTVASILAVALIGVVLWALGERANRQRQHQFDETEAAERTYMAIYEAWRTKRDVSHDLACYRASTGRWPTEAESAAAVIGAYLNRLGDHDGGGLWLDTPTATRSPRRTRLEPLAA
jgi:hypothetical protein